MATPARNFFSREEKSNIRQAILNAELDTSGEIRVHIENHCDQDVLDRTTEMFEKLKMHDTSQRNGVLFYLAVADQKFGIIGDLGINKMVPANFWDEIKSKMENRFRQGEFTQGLIEGIEMAGKQLKKHFPHQTDDINELTDDISFGTK